MISQKSVQDIISTAKVDEIVQEFVTLKRRGVNMIGLCPFHNEKTPSFTVSPEKNIFKCFGCGRGGNTVQFLMEHEQMSFPEALRYLAKKYNIEIEETGAEQNAEERQLAESLLIINEFARDFFIDKLFNSPEGKTVGMSYFKERGFLLKTMEHFQLGYSSGEKDVFTRAAVDKGYNIELLRKVGLTTRFDSDFMKNRVIFPIHNLSGKVIGFGGRALSKAAKAKYINSPESEIYNKRKTLYGLHFSRKAIRKDDECLIVEGYTDVISLHQNGIENVVAASGTSLTVDQVRLIKRFTKNVKFLFDGDPAGLKAALRGLDIVLEQDMNIKIVVLPEGEDPDSLIKGSGKAAFEEYMNSKAKDFILFKAEFLNQEASEDPIKRSEVIQNIVNSLAKIPNPIARSLYVQETSSLLNIPENILLNSINKIIRKDLYQKRIAKPGPSSLDESLEHITPPLEVQGATDQGSAMYKEDEFQEKDIVRILLTLGEKVYDPIQKTTVGEHVIRNIEDVISYFDHPLYEKIVKECVQLFEKGEKIEASYFLHHPDKDIQTIAIDLTTSPFEYSENWEKRWGISLQTQPMPAENFESDSRQSIMRFKMKKIDKLIKENIKRLQNTDDNPENADQRSMIMKVHYELLKRKSKIADEFGTVVY